MKALQKRFDYNYHFSADKEVTVLQYIWIGGRGIDIRGKTMVLQKIITSIEEVPDWFFGGDAAYLLPGSKDSDFSLKPRFMCKDPFRAPNYPHSYIVLCDTYQTDQETPLKNNFRHFAVKVQEETKAHEPWVGIEQEYILVNPTGALNIEPLGFPKQGYPKDSDQYYCSCGATNAYGRAISEDHMNACNYAGLLIGGTNAETFPGQWEYQIGPGPIVEVSDQMWVSRYILDRIAEDYGCDVTYHPKPIKGNWAGSGCHTNFSTKETRECGERGNKEIEKHMEQLKKYNERAAAVSGIDNEMRMTGRADAGNLHEFTWGHGDRTASVRIPGGKDCRGYYEDRRPAGNCDPWIIGAMIADSVLLDGKYGEEMVKSFKWGAENVENYGRDVII